MRFMNETLRRTADSRLAINFDYHNVVDARFLRHTLDDDLTVMRGDGWITSAGADRVPGEVLAQANYSRAERLECLVSLKDAVAHLIFYELALHVRVAARDEASCERALQQIRAALPPDFGAGEEIPVSFWWWQGHMPQEMGRRMPAPRWDEIGPNYSDRTLAALEPMFSWQAPPVGGRLILWHGEPGTGKTTAIRALARQWREWADFQFITDPECFLQIPDYLLHTISERGRPTGVRAEWRVLVLEDSGEFLMPDAKQVAGQALSRLLNVCDGALGHATRTLVLVTTNEELGFLHPALSRPGRCLAQIEFHELRKGEIDRWCGAREIVPPSCQRATLADLFAHADGRLKRDHGVGFGFATEAA
jgi:hypothetical protein